MTTIECYEVHRLYRDGGSRYFLDYFFGQRADVTTAARSRADEYLNKSCSLELTRRPDVEQGFAELATLNRDLAAHRTDVPEELWLENRDRDLWEVMRAPVSRGPDGWRRASAGEAVAIGVGRTASDAVADAREYCLPVVAEEGGAS